jgi:hypothetical protein
MIYLAVFGYENFLTLLKKRYKLLNLKKINIALIILYFTLSPLSLYRVKQILFHQKLTMNSAEFYTFNNRLNQTSGTTVLSSWEGLSAFSNKQTLYKENYVLSYIGDLVDKDTKAKYGLVTREYYKKMIEDKFPDIIVFDAGNAAHLSGLENSIRAGYEEAFEYNTVTVYTKK